MQEGTVGWDPISINHQLPLGYKIFVLYCFFVFVVSIIRSIKLARELWFGGSLAERKVHSEKQFLCSWHLCVARVRGLRRLAVCTGLVTFFVFSNGVTNTLANVSTLKTFGIAAITGGLAELGTLMSLGAFTMIVLYGTASLYDGVLARRRAWYELGQSNTSPQ